MISSSSPSRLYWVFIMVSRVIHLKSPFVFSLSGFVYVLGGWWWGCWKSILLLFSWKTLSTFCFSLLSLSGVFGPLQFRNCLLPGEPLRTGRVRGRFNQSQNSRLSGWQPALSALRSQHLEPAAPELPGFWGTKVSLPLPTLCAGGRFQSSLPCPSLLSLWLILPLTAFCFFILFLLEQRGEGL